VIRKPFLEHLEDLRRLLFKCLILSIFCAVIIYTQVRAIFPLITKPVGNLIFIYPAELFLVYIRVSFILGVIAASPFIFFELWRFLAEALHKKEKGVFLSFVVASYLLFILGLCFGYFIVVPILLQFFLSFSTETISPSLSVEKYLAFMTMLSVSCGVIFQLPVVTSFLTKIGLVNTLFLARKRRYVFVLILVVAALLSPPDVISQILFAIPLVILYEISIVISRFISTH